MRAERLIEIMRAAALAVLMLLVLPGLPLGGAGCDLQAPSDPAQAGEGHGEERSGLEDDEDELLDKRTGEPEAEVPDSAIGNGEEDSAELAPFLPSPPEIVDVMLRLAAVTEKDVVYDLGAGDGRICIAAARSFGAAAVGVELDAELFRQAKERVGELGLADRVTMINGDLMEVDLTAATVVCIYLLPAANRKLKDRFEKQLKPGTRVVSHDFRMPGWKPAAQETVEVESEFSRTHTVFLYRR